MATLTFKDAEDKARRGRPWTFRLQFQGLDPSNQSGWSDKFWLATGRGLNEPVEVYFGATGTKGQIIVKDWAYVTLKAAEKEAKGYRPVATPFVRVRQQTIDAFNAQKGAQGQGRPAPAPQPAPVPKASPKRVKKMNPYDRITQVEPDPAAGNWKALDSTGTLVMRLSKDGARQIVQQNPVIQVLGL